ncbi:hypothetical protein [Lactococcus lactis]
MFKRKKFMALCATTLAGISALGSFAPMAASADVAKNGDTVVTYEGVPKPAEWGLSVPATVKLDTEVNGYKIHNDKIEIVKVDGSTFEDTTTDHNFSISGTVKNLGANNKPVLVNVNDSTKTTPLLLGVTSQGASDPGIGSLDIRPNTSKISNIAISTKQDNSSSAPHVYLRSAVTKSKAESAANGADLNTTISWTVTEKTS